MIAIRSAKSSIEDHSSVAEMLDRLPREILGSILEYAACTTTLWMCGSRVLQLRLSSAVESLYLTHIPANIFVVPHWLPQLSNIKSLTLYSPTSLSELTSVVPELFSQLPSSLESLTLDYTDSNQTFHAFVKHRAQSPIGQQALPSFFPHLKSLTAKRAMPLFPAEFLSILPRTLTSLDIDPGHMFFPFCSALPRCLQYLNASIKMGNVQPHGDQLFILRQFEDFASMPPDLYVRKLLVDASHLKDVQLLKKLPPLHTLEIVHLSAAMIPYLPRSLVYLDFGRIGLDSWAKCADSALNSHDEGSYGRNTDRILDWPPALQEMRLSLRSCEAGLLAALPRSLLRLHLTIFIRLGTNIPIFADELPPTLQALTLATPDSTGFLLSGRLPSSLVHLTVLDEMDPSSLSAVLHDSIVTLDIMVLVLGSRNRPSSGYALPTHLSSLSVSIWRTDWLGELPPTLTRFKIRDAMIHIRLADLDLIPSLPAGLTSLEVELLKTQTPLFLAFKAGQLPLLRHLKLPHEYLMLSASLKYLPRSLKTLEVTILKLESTLKCLASLPPLLEECRVFRYTPRFDSDEIGEYWPPTAWRCLITDKLRLRHIPRLRERLAAASISHPK